ncbi:MAG: MerR family transcriptional regulator [Alphaproteobacteria bacterium]
MVTTIDNSLRKRRRSKAPGAFRTISEVATDLEVPQHVLRFWESKFAQVKPLKRGGGRRYYRPEDVDLLRGIRHLLYSDGYTIKGAQKLLRELGSKSIMESGRSLSGAVGVDATHTPRPGRAAFGKNSDPPPELPLSIAAQAGNSHGLDRMKKGNLTPLQRDKLQYLVAVLGELRDILREAGRKG